MRQYRCLPLHRHPNFVEAVIAKLLEAVQEASLTRVNSHLCQW